MFCRFAGCNLWTGLEPDRRRAVCQFCDTDFVGTDGDGGGKFKTAEDLAAAVEAVWTAALPGEASADAARRQTRANRLVVCTGGEPLLQLDEAAVAAFHQRGFRIAVETNGTKQAPHGIDWICVSPKAGADFILRRGHELKLVFPQPDLMPHQIPDVDFENYFIQPMDGPEITRNTQDAIAYCLRDPKWRLSLQTHKMIGIP